MILYWIHRIGHSVRFINFYHSAHHSFINKQTSAQVSQKWHWSNLLLFNDNKDSTIDLWLTEVIPTIAFSAITNQWWIFAVYYIWAAFFQEAIEHNNNINIPGILSGKKHLIHHKHVNKNYGLIFPIWDIVFFTYRKN